MASLNVLNQGRGQDVCLWHLLKSYERFHKASEIEIMQPGIHIVSHTFQINTHRLLSNLL